MIAISRSTSSKSCWVKSFDLLMLLIATSRPSARRMARRHTPYWPLPTTSLMSYAATMFSLLLGVLGLSFTAGSIVLFPVHALGALVSFQSKPRVRALLACFPFKGRQARLASSASASNPSAVLFRVPSVAERTSKGKQTATDAYSRVVDSFGRARERWRESASIH